jgi:uncharacterized membrane-anchored protein YhcB (DUF1043 family)
MGEKFWTGVVMGFLTGLVVGLVVVTLVTEPEHGPAASEAADARTEAVQEDQFPTPAPVVYTF